MTIVWCIEIDDIFSGGDVCYWRLTFNSYKQVSRSDLWNCHWSALPPQNRNPGYATGRTGGQGSFSWLFINWFLSLTFYPFHREPTAKDFFNYGFDTRLQRASSVRTIATRLRAAATGVLESPGVTVGTRRLRLSGVSFSTGFPYCSNGYRVPHGAERDGPNTITCLPISYTIRRVMDAPTKLDMTTFGRGFLANGRACLVFYLRPVSRAETVP